jgi:hypothetical protein
MNKLTFKVVKKIPGMKSEPYSYKSFVKKLASMRTGTKVIINPGYQTKARSMRIYSGLWYAVKASHLGRRVCIHLRGTRVFAQVNRKERGENE